MFGIDAINAMNDEAARKASKNQVKPLIAVCDEDENVFKCPKIGGYEPEGFEKIDELFVDSSGFGSPTEPALTPKQFVAKVKKGLGYAIISEGQFQVYIGVYKKI